MQKALSIGERFESTDCHRVTYERSLCLSNNPLSAERPFCGNSHLVNSADQNEFCFIREAFKKCKLSQKESNSSVRDYFRVNCRSFVALTQEQDTKTFLDKTFSNPFRGTFKG